MSDAVAVPPPVQHREWSRADQSKGGKQSFCTLNARMLAGCARTSTDWLSNQERQELRARHCSLVLSQNRILDRSRI
jgi:hypothetical protein